MRLLLVREKIKDMRNGFKKFIVAATRIVPPSVWERVEVASAYFSGKGSGSDFLAGEVKAASRFLAGDSCIVFDIGANCGDWTSGLLARARERIGAVYQFEPSVHNQNVLKERFAGDKRVMLVPFAVSEKKGSAKLFSDTPGSGMASLHKRRLEHFGVTLEEGEVVETITVDSFIKDRDIRHVDFMKIDIEGHELSALHGASEALRAGMIKALAFEFGGTDIDSRTYFQDFWYFLTPMGYRFYRILPNGSLHAIANYTEALECFRTTNYIAVRKTNER